MTPQTRIRRIGWIAALGTCMALYALLHINVNAMHAEVVSAEHQIIALENENLLLETEFLTRSNQVQLAAWNRVDFGFQSPSADQFIDGPRQLAQFSSPPAAGAPEPIRLASLTTGEDAPEFPKLVSPLTGKPMEAEPSREGVIDAGHLAVAVAPGPVRVELSASVELARR